MVWVKNEVMAALIEAYQVEQRADTYVMAPFWLACAEAIPMAVASIHHWWVAKGLPEELAKALIEFRRRGWNITPPNQEDITVDNFVKALEQILIVAAGMLNIDGYKKNIVRMWAVFPHGSDRLDQAKARVLEAIQHLSERLPKLTPDEVKREYDESASELRQLRGRLGILANLLPIGSFNILVEVKHNNNLLSLLSIAIVGRAMAGYIKAHYAERLLR